MSSTEPFGEPPKPFRQPGAGLLELVEGGGCLFLFGLPFFAAGVWNLSHPKTILISLPFILVGGFLMFARKKITIDAASGIVRAQYSILMPLRTREHSVSEFSAVTLGLLTDSDSPDHYPVNLRAKTGKDFKLTSPMKYGEGRSQAEYLARFLNLSLVDSVTDHETSIAPGHASAPLRERARDLDLDRVTPPAQMRSQVDESRTEIIVTIPGKSGTFFSLIFAAATIVGITFFMKMFVGATAPLWVRVAFAIFLAVVFLLPSLLASARFLFGVRSSTVVTASPAGLNIEQRDAWKSKTTSIRSEDIFDLDLSTPRGMLEQAKDAAVRAGYRSAENVKLASSLASHLPSKGIIVKSRQDLVTLGEGLPSAELNYLRFVLRKALIGTPAPNSARG